MKLFLAQINPTVGAISQNLDRILQAIEAAKGAAADLIVFPELALSGAPLNDLLFHHDFVDECERSFQKVASASKGIIVILGSPATDGNSVFDAAVLFHDGKEVGRQHDVCWCWNIGGKQIAVTIGDVRPKSFQEKIDLIVHLAASPWAPGAQESRISSVKQQAQALNVPYLFVNLVGGNDGWIFDGNSFICSSKGEMVFQANAFSEYVGMVKEGAFLFEGVSPIREVHQALLLGMTDFFKKQQITDALVGLSGGIDSSVTAVLASQALGASHVHGVLLPSRYTSPESIEGATALARSLGIHLRTIPIEPMMEVASIGLSIGKREVAGTTLENLQSRIRSLFLMGITNAEGSLLLGTGNKSEVALGYTTLYGDLCGALLPLGDLFKTEVYELAQYLNERTEVVPHSILLRAPTAELRSNQKDSDDLPEYRLLDPILQALVLEGLSPEQVAVRTGMGIKTVERLAKRMMRNEFKRRQAPCILRVSNKAFGMDVVYPIVNCHNH